MLSTDQILGLGGTPVGTDVLDQSNHRVYQKECAGCMRIQPFGCFRRDSSYKEGVRDLCLTCESSPKLSTIEHLARQKEMAYWSAGKQRWQNQEDYENEEARWGRVMHSSELILKIRRIVKDGLFLIDGRIGNDISIYRVYGTPQPDLEGRTFRYLFYCPQGRLPEFSQYEFDHRDVPIKEKRRGWRTVLLRLIKTGLVSEDAVNKEFGTAEGEASTVWRRNLWQHRNG